MPIYERPIWGLMEDAVSAQADAFTSDDILNWFRSHYPKIKDSSVKAHIVGMTANNPTRRHYSGTLAHGILYRLGRSRFTRYDPSHHGEFDQYGRQLGLSESEEEEEGLGPAGELFRDGDEAEAVVEFALEQHLEEFMQRNWSRIDFGRSLEIWSDEHGVSGRQYPTDVGYIDFLCRDKDSGSFVVIELKKGRTSDVVVGQTQRYMGWVQRNVASDGQSVEGLIIASEVDTKLQYALEVAPNISVRLYRVEFQLAEAANAFGS